MPLSIVDIVSICIVHVFQMRKMRLGNMSPLPMVMQLVSGKLGIQTQDFLILDFLLGSTAA